MLYLFFFNDTATTEIYTLSLHDALPILQRDLFAIGALLATPDRDKMKKQLEKARIDESRIKELEHRSEEHTSELQSRLHLVCRLLLEEKKKIKNISKNLKETTEIIDKKS